MKRHETPVKRTYPSGRTVWIARWTDRLGNTRYGHPDVDGPADPLFDELRQPGNATYGLRKWAQGCIDACYQADLRAPRETGTVGAYLPLWLARHPRSHRTNHTNEHRIKRVLDVTVDGKPFRDWEMHAIRRRQVNDLVTAMLVDQGRAHTGAQNILRALSVMFEDAIGDECCDVNPIRGVSVRKTDPRIRKRIKAKPLFTFEEMHRFADNDPLLRCFTDLGLRFGEVLPLRHADMFEDPDKGWYFLVRRTAHEGRILEGTKTDHGESAEGRVVPIPPTLLELLQAIPRRIETPLLFPTPRLRLWRESNFVRAVWKPALDRLPDKPENERLRKLTRQDCRRSWENHLRKAGIDPVELGAVAGHTVETMMGHYVQPTHDSYDAIRKVIG